MTSKQFLLILTLSVFLMIVGLVYHNNKTRMVNYNNYIEEDYMEEIVYSAENYCLKTENFGGIEIDFSNYNNELELEFETPKEGIITINSNCEVKVRKNVIINDKSCAYDDKIKCIKKVDNY